jgi:hypothetical protein
VEPGPHLLELGGELEQEAVGSEGADQLYAEGQTGARPVQRDADRRSPGEVASWVYGTQPRLSAMIWSRIPEAASSLPARALATPWQSS